MDKWNGLKLEAAPEKPLAPGLHPACTRLAPGLHPACTRLAPNAYISGPGKGIDGILSLPRKCFVRLANATSFPLILQFIIRSLCYRFLIHILLHMWEARWLHGYSALDSSASGPGSSPGREHGVVFLGKTPFTLTALLFTLVYKLVLANLMLGLTLRWTGIPSRGSRNTPSRLMLL